MRTVKVSFRRHVFKGRGLYKCQTCGRRYQRTVMHDWTENPFHEWQGREAELNKKAKDAIVAKLNEEKCSRCDVGNVPNVIEWV